MKHEIDPKIKLDSALKLYGNNQSRLARALCVSRSVVNEWCSSEMDLVPPLHAYRLQRLHPNEFSEAA